MKKASLVSFEGNDAKIIHLSYGGSSIIVDRAETIPEEEFDSYLQREKATDFIVTCEFKESYHDVLTIPLMKPRYLEKIIESEIRKTTGKKDFTFIYTRLAERLINNRKMLDIYYFIAGNELIHSIVERFYNCGKTVKALYPSFFSAASLLRSDTLQGINMGIYGSEKERIVIYAKDGAVHFIRNYAALEDEFSDYDIQNINLTINYCSQNLRINPSSVILFGHLSECSTMETLPTPPLASYYQSDNIQCKREVFNDYFLPIASLHASKSNNILSRDFKHLNLLRDAVDWTSKVFVSLTIICVCLITYAANNAFDKKEQIEAATASIYSVKEIYSKYAAREDALTRITPVVDFLNNSSPKIHELLIKLIDIDRQQIQFNYIEARADGSSFVASIHGSSNVDSYQSFQTSFDKMIETLSNLKTVEVQNKAINLGAKTFSIELRHGNHDELL